MIKTLKNLFKQDKEKFTVPIGAQDIIPVKTIYEDGIFKVGGKYAKTFRFEDINYAVASREDKEAMFLEYSELLNSLDSGATTKITINNRRLNKTDFEQTILIPLASDDLDNYRKEYNKMLLDKATGANAIVQDKYVTITVAKKNIEEARNYFARVGADLISHFGRLGSKCVELDATDMLSPIMRVRAKTNIRSGNQALATQLPNLARQSLNMRWSKTSILTTMILPSASFSMSSLKNTVQRDGWLLPMTAMWVYLKTMSTPIGATKSSKTFAPKPWTTFIIS